MYKGAIITETQKNILQGIMFKDNSLFSPFERGGQWYISEAEVLQNTNIDVNWVNNLNIVDLPPLNFWHEEDKAIQLVQSQEGFNWTAINFIQLADYRGAMNIATYQHDGKFYYYVNNVLPEHKTLFETKEDEEGNKLPGFYIDITINEK